MKEDFLKNLTDEQKEVLLRDTSGNDIPDFLEHGILPEELGIKTGEPMDEQNRTVRKGRLKLMAKFVRVSKLKEQMANGQGLSFQQLMEENAQSRVKQWIPYIILIDALVMGVVLYFVFR
ncbi:MAG: hypothetical protein ABII02_02680 [Candidatus Magasanikbacteria bacterium]